MWSIYLVCACAGEGKKERYIGERRGMKGEGWGFCLDE
jgi:hypothetical protein